MRKKSIELVFEPILSLFVAESSRRVGEFKAFLVLKQV